MKYSPLRCQDCKWFAIDAAAYRLERYKMLSLFNIKFRICDINPLSM